MVTWRTKGDQINVSRRQLPPVWVSVEDAVFRCGEQHIPSKISPINNPCTNFRLHFADYKDPQKMTRARIQVRSRIKKIDSPKDPKKWPRHE